MIAFLLLSLCMTVQANGTPVVFNTGVDQSITDQAGRRIAVTKPFKRIISLYGAHTENLFELGLNEEIIGVGKNEAYPSEALNRPVYSYHDDPEKFLAARPELVLIRPMIDRGYPNLIKRLEQNGITVVSLQPNTLENMFIYWQILGKLTGRTDRAKEMVNRFKNDVAEVRSLTRTISLKKKVYFEAIHSRMKTFSPYAMAIFVLESAGGINIAHDARPVRGTHIAFYGKERILSHAREIDAYIAQKGAMNNPTIETIKNEPGFHVIKAIRNGKILIIDEMIVSRPTLRLLNGVNRVGRFLYPQKFERR